MHLLKRMLAPAAILLLAGCAARSAAPSSAQTPVAVVSSIPVGAAQDSWSGPDKIKHFFISAFIESIAFGGLQAIGAGRNAAFAGAIGTTAAFAFAREAYDKRTKGIFSIPDLTWDAAGAGAALLVLRSTQQ